ncbi:hypothetical protein [Bacillus halotolerans]|uniref:hypothetical protein n=1 Tax=Bacillus halotolerans TaxID=260554 RepID=UPI00192B5F3C|nr:hypothetical protein [Bacillus halotolerans]MBL4967717.1 hypothetical protein [Bacillus halotolerans]MBL4971787.1 hypothetical protein [Bacillus halotolerans]
MNMTYRTGLFLQTLLPILLYVLYWHSPSTLTLLLAVIGTARVLYSAAHIHRNKLWGNVHFQNDQRTRSNAHFAGYISHWVMIVILLIGVVLIHQSMLPLSYLQLIAYTAFLGFMLRIVISDVLNTNV